MSDLPPIVYRGAFIPFPNPIPALTTDPLSATDHSLCFADEWLPAILGALKVLCRPETWTGTDADIKTAMLNAQELLASFTDNCGAILVPFACPGDFSESDSPYGVWSIGYTGFYFAGHWYGSTGPATSFSTHYYGVEIKVHLSAPMNIHAIHMVYDVGGVQYDGDMSLATNYITDNTHSALLASTTRGAQHVGTNQGLNAYPTLEPIQDLTFGVYPGAWDAGPFLGVADAQITHIDISGTIPSGGTTPCS